MKRLAFILAIISLILLVFIEITFIVNLVDENLKSIEFILGQTLILILVSYIFLTNFGLNKINDTFPKRLFIVFSFIFLFPLLVFLGLTISEEMNSKALKSARDFEKESLEKAIVWDNIQSFGVDYSLKTRLINNKLQYILVGIYEETKPQFSRLTLVFYDEEGFIIAEIYLEEWTRLMENEKEVGLEKNDYFNWPDYESYKRIKSFKILKRN